MVRPRAQWLSPRLRRDFLRCEARKARRRCAGNELIFSSCRSVGTCEMFPKYTPAFWQRCGQSTHPVIRFMTSDKSVFRPKDQHTSCRCTSPTAEVNAYRYVAVCYPVVWIELFRNPLLIRCLRTQSEPKPWCRDTARRLLFHDFCTAGRTHIRSEN